MRRQCGMLKLVVTLGLILWSTNTVFAASGDKGSLDIMFWNTLNLFDSEHDEGKNDWTYLPDGYPGKAEYCETLSNARYREDCYNSDWKPENVDLKINQLVKGVRATTNNNLPDMLGLCEVENHRVVKKFANKLGYQKFVMSDSPDKRGIDVALLYKPSSKLKYIGYREHVVEMTSVDQRATRNILEVEFDVKGDKLLVFVNHWPSQAAPSPVRVAVAKQVQGIIDQRLSKKSSTKILLMGDFNVVQGDFPHPFKTVTLSRDERNPMKDVEKLSTAPSNVKKLMPTGTYFYVPKMEWNRLDRFFASSSLTNGRGLQIDKTSFRVLAKDPVRKDFRYDNDAYYSDGTIIKGIPYRGNILARTPEEAGYSDHFPIFMKLKY